MQLSIKTIFENECKLIQLLDVSEKFLYIEVKSEHSFLEMINAAVSHELRNPLNSLIGQVTAMKEIFKSFKRVIDDLHFRPEIS